MVRTIILKTVLFLFCQFIFKNFKPKKYFKTTFILYRERKYFFRYKKLNENNFSLEILYKKFLKNLNHFFFIFNIYPVLHAFFNYSEIIFKKIYVKNIKKISAKTLKRFFRDGLIYIKSLIIVFFVDASFSDDEPLWEPIEWSLVLTWILFIFIFGWIAENLITSRYGSYTGRDKKVWSGWYKTQWFLEVWFAISYCLAAMFVIVPFYSELVYPVFFSVSWWNWLSRVFFFKFISIYTCILLFVSFLQFFLKWLNWKKLLFLILIVNFFLLYLLYTHIIMFLFSYFTDPLWYQKTRYVDFIFLSHEPWRWGWGAAKRDHFSYHKTTTVFWFKNDAPFAGSFLLIQMFFLISLFLLYIYWISLLRRVYSTKEITTTFFTFCFSALKQFFYFFFLMYALIIISFIGNYWKFPIEFIWLENNNNIGTVLWEVIKDYPNFLWNIFFK